MDYKPIKNKSIGIFCNQTAVNRNDNHILDLIGKDKSIDVKAIFEPEYGIWGVDDSRAKLSGCLLYTSPSPRDVEESRMPSSA